MLRTLRRTRFGALICSATLASVLALSVASWVHSENDDADFAAVVVHDHAAHRLVGAKDTPHATDHCFVCHWTSLRTVQSAVALHVPTTESCRLTKLAAADPTATTFANQPARAPPLA